MQPVDTGEEEEDIRPSTPLIIDLCLMLTLF